MGKKFVQIEEDEQYITLQSLLKMNDVVPTGGAVKYFLNENIVLVNNEPENRRGRKLYRGDEIQVGNTVFVIN